MPIVYPILPHRGPDAKVVVVVERQSNYTRIQ
jgi:hypothetical protein